MDYIEKLISFGLTRQEATIYVQLLKCGELTGYEVAKVTGISKSNVYSALEGLVQKGAAHFEEAEAKKFFANDIESFCNGFIREHEKIAKDLIENKPKAKENRDGYITIAGVKNIDKKIYDMISSCKLRLYFMAEASVIKEYSEMLKTLLKEDKKVVILTNEDIIIDGASMYRTDIENSQIRLITDSANVLTGQIRGSEDDTCLYSGQENLVEIMKEALKNKIVLIEKGIE